MLALEPGFVPLSTVVTIRNPVPNRPRRLLLIVRRSPTAPLGGRSFTFSESDFGRPLPDPPLPPPQVFGELSEEELRRALEVIVESL